jgi:hypothetical protein
MRLFLTIFSLFTFILVSNCQSIEKDAVPLQATQHKLFIKDKNSRNKTRLKKNETVKIFFQNNSDSLYAKILLWNDEGIYYTPYSLKSDSSLIDSIQNKYYKFEYLQHNTVEFTKFNEIGKINYRKNLRLRTEANLLLFTTSTLVTVIPLILHPIIDGSYKNFGPEWLIIVGSGAIVSAYTWWRIKRLEKLKSYSMNDYEFVIK